MRHLIAAAIIVLSNVAGLHAGGSYTVVDTGQVHCYDTFMEIAYPARGARLYGQDGQYKGVQAAYRDNGDGTVSDLNTGLMWQQAPGVKVTHDLAASGAAACRLGGFTDWRLPTIKELYSLIDFHGTDPGIGTGTDTSRLVPFINTNYFRFAYGDTSAGERIIDSQYASSTYYVGNTGMLVGVNFADGRIKGYGLAMPGRGAKMFSVMYVRGNPGYGRNHFVDNSDGTVTDTATGLVWQKGDSCRGMNWADALAYAAQLDLGGHHDWRLPSAKELQSIVDYTRAPGITRSAAIDPLFVTSPITNEAGQPDYPYYWTGTTHASSDRSGAAAVYVAFGRAMGFMHGHWVDVHGAGAQRSDPKQGNPADYPQGRGPQGDAIRILNYARCVRGGVAVAGGSGPAVQAPTALTSEPRQEKGSGFGQAKEGRKPGRFVQRLDRNGDGKVSREEFDGPPDQFDVLDLDHDGFLSEKEAPPPFQHGPRPPR